jgi:DedD protein
MAENQDVNTLKRRGRRRLVGAIALVLAAVIVLPMVFDSEPKGSAPPVSVRIPGENETGFTPKVTPKSPPVQEQKAPETAVEKAAEKVPEAQPGAEQFMVPAGAYVDPAGIIEKLKAAQIPYYTEPIATKQGTVTRVRAGPFASRDAAEKALQQLKGLGLKPGNVATKA